MDHQSPDKDSTDSTWRQYSENLVESFPELVLVIEPVAKHGIGCQRTEYIIHGSRKTVWKYDWLFSTIFPVTHLENYASSSWQISALLHQNSYFQAETVLLGGSRVRVSVECEAVTASWSFWNLPNSRTTDLKKGVRLGGSVS